MEAESVEDHGEGVKFNVYVYNVQPGITIDYATGRQCFPMRMRQRVREKPVEIQRKRRMC